MSRHHFTEILRYIRFYKKKIKAVNACKLINLRLCQLFGTKFIVNSQNCLKPVAYTTVDEQLFPTKATCRFTQYMPNKPDKFEIKFLMTSYVETKYGVIATYV